MAHKTLTPAQVAALRTAERITLKGLTGRMVISGRAATLAVLVRLELAETVTIAGDDVPWHVLTRAGRNIAATLDNGAPTLEHVAYVVREVSRVNWNAPQTFYPNEDGATTIHDARPLFHNGSAVSVVWHPMSGDAFCYAGTTVIGRREDVQDMTTREAKLWSLGCVAAKGERTSPTLKAADARTLADDRAARTAAKGVAITMCGLGTHVAPIVGYYSNLDGHPVYVCADHSDYAGDALRPMPAAPVPVAEYVTSVRVAAPVTPRTPLGFTHDRVTSYSVADALTHAAAQARKYGVDQGVYTDAITLGRTAVAYVSPDGTVRYVNDYANPERAHMVVGESVDAPADNGHTLVHYVETEARGTYYKCDGCGSIGPRDSFTDPCVFPTV
jgi:hypothetical protein